MNEPLDIHVIRELSDDIVSVLKSLANKDRLLILSLLLNEELNVSEIEAKIQSIRIKNRRSSRIRDLTFCFRSYSCLKIITH